MKTPHRGISASTLLAAFLFSLEDKYCTTHHIQDVFFKNAKCSTKEDMKSYECVGEYKVDQVRKKV